jgi:hypothetical protein
MVGPITCLHESHEGLEKQEQRVADARGAIAHGVPTVLFTNMKHGEN